MMITMIKQLDIQKGRPHGPRGPKGGCGPEGSIRPVAPVFINVHVKFPIYSAKDDEDAENYLLHNNDCMNSKTLQKMQNVEGFALPYVMISTYVMSQ